MLEGDLRLAEAKLYSQNGEDGIIAEIFARLRVDKGHFVEFGAATGEECNCRYLVLEKGWSGLFIEAQPERFRQLKSVYAEYERVSCKSEIITSGNIEELFRKFAVPADFDLLSIDIDGNDFWVWRALRAWRPRVVVIEYNAAFPLPIKRVAREATARFWNGTSYFGASLGALDGLGKEKGYRLIATDSRGVNAFFLREDLFDSGKFVDADAAYHYSPPRYGIYGRGHPPGCGEYLDLP